MEDKKYSDFTVTILGCGSAMPSKHHYPSAQLIQYKGAQYICDAGECLQYQLDKVHASSTKVRAVFITHLHGDHVFGLIGYLMMLGVARRTQALHIYGPDGLEDFITHQLDLMCPNMKYDIIFHVVDVESVIYEDNYIIVESVRMKHKDMDCFGYIFCEKIYNSVHIKIDMIERNGIEKKYINDIKARYVEDPDSVIEIYGKTVKCSEYCTVDEKPSRKYAYCTDNSFDRTLNEDGTYHSHIDEDTHLVKKLKGVDVLYHEASFMKSEMENAIRYGHSTAYEAGLLAHYAKVDTLILGHISARYEDEGNLLGEATEVFDNTYVANEFQIYNIF